MVTLTLSGPFRAFLAAGFGAGEGVTTAGAAGAGAVGEGVGVGVGDATLGATLAAGLEAGLDAAGLAADGLAGLAGGFRVIRSSSASKGSSSSTPLGLMVTVFPSIETTFADVPSGSARLGVGSMR